MKRIIVIMLSVALCVLTFGCSSQTLDSLDGGEKEFKFHFPSGTEMKSVEELFKQREKDANSGRYREDFDNWVIGTKVSGTSEIVSIERSWGGSYSTAYGSIPYAYNFFIYLEGDVVLCLHVGYDVSSKDTDLIDNEAAYGIDLYEGDTISFSAPVDDSMTWEGNLRLELKEISKASPYQKLDCDSIPGIELAN